MPTHKPLAREATSFDPLQGFSLSLLTVTPPNPLVTPILLNSFQMPQLEDIDYSEIYHQINQHEQANNLDRFLNPETRGLLSRSNYTQFNFRNFARQAPRHDPDQWQHFCPEQAKWREWWAACKMKDGLLLMPEKKMSNEEKLSNTSSYDSISEDYRCAISGEVMDDPVYDPEFPNNHRCERQVLKVWLDQYGTNPFTRSQLSAANLVSDVALKNQIDSFVDSIVTPSPQT